MRKRMRALLAATLAMVMLISPISALTFPDVSASADYAEAVDYISEIGVMVGDEKGNFNPDKIVSRAEMAVIICNMMGENEGLQKKSGLFTDVPASHWANAYIAKAVELGAISGRGNGTFGPNDTVKYEDALTMIVRAMALTEEAVENGGYPYGYIYVAKENGFTDSISAQKGDLMKRGEVTVVLYNVAV